MEGHTFSVEAMVRGHHVYKEIWMPVEGEVLPCTRDVGNSRDPMAVAVKKGADVVGHLPRKISAICSIFLRRGGSITCRVVGHRRYSTDLEQGGLEVPCILTFSSPHSQAINGEKAEKLVKSALAVKTTQLHCIATSSSESSSTDTSRDTCCSNSNIVLSCSKQKPIIISSHDDEPADTEMNPTDQPQAKKPGLADMEVERLLWESDYLIFT